MRYLPLWKLIADGTLPEGVEIICDTLGIRVNTEHGKAWAGGEDASIHRSAAMLIVDAWEKQGKMFTRSWGIGFGEGGKGRIVDYTWSEVNSGLTGSYHPDELTSLLRCLALVGGATQDQIAE